MSMAPHGLFRDRNGADHRVLLKRYEPDGESIAPRTLAQVGHCVAMNAVPLPPFAFIGCDKRIEMLGVIGQETDPNAHSARIAKMRAPATMRYQPKGLSP